MTVGLKRPSVDVVFSQLRPLDDVVFSSLMEHLTRTTYVTFGLSREELGLSDQAALLRVVSDPTTPMDGFEIRGATQTVRVVDVVEKPLDRFAAVALEMEMIE